MAKDVKIMPKPNLDNLLIFQKLSVSLPRNYDVIMFSVVNCDFKGVKSKISYLKHHNFPLDSYFS